MLRDVIFGLVPKSENAATKLSIKKLQYLKKPNIPMLTIILTNSHIRRLRSSDVLWIFRATR